MTKEEAKSRLKRAGYQVTEDNSVVTVLIDNGRSIRSAVRDVKSKLNEWGYDSSFAVRQHAGGQIENLDEEAGLDDFSVEDESPAEKDEPLDDSTGTAETDKDSAKNEEDGFFDEEDDDNNPPEEIKIDEEDMDMLLNEDSVQFSLEDFGMNY